jgi:hypothetical protein
MGTNFYFDKDHSEHIGKRSAAGLYCWDCCITLCKGGIEKIHFSENQEWFDACPCCGKVYEKEGLREGNAAGIELGFSKPVLRRKKGVSSVSSFTWDIHPGLVMKRCLAREKVWDEYGQSYSGKRFLTLIKNTCPVQYSLIGGEFS